MLDTTSITHLSVTPVGAGEVADSNFKSVVGHPDTANVLAEMLGKAVPMNRTSIHLEKGDVLYVGQIVGGRLPKPCHVLDMAFLSFSK